MNRLRIPALAPHPPERSHLIKPHETIASFFRLAFLACLAITLSCSSSTEPGPPAATLSPSLSTISSANASIVADGTTQTAINVTLKDTNGAAYGKSGGAVTLSTSSGTLGPVADLNNGSYSATLTSSRTAGNALVTASIAAGTIGSGATVAFVPGPVAAIGIANPASNGQTAIVGATVANPPSVKVADANGNGVSGQSVTFAVTSGGGSVTGLTQTTDAAGLATAGSWRLGAVAGANTVVATVTTAAVVAAGSSSSAVDRTVTFTATGIAGTPGSISISGGDGQTAAAGALVAIPPSVKVVDANNNPVAGVTVNFSLGPAGGTVIGGNATTNSSGIATVTSWRLGPIAGPNSLTASTPGVSGLVTITATGIAGPAAKIENANPASNGQNAPAGNAVAIPPSVKVSDANGNTVAGVSVTFAVASGSGSVSGASQTTNASGIATVESWTLGTAAGANTVTATSGSLDGSPVTFTATGTSGAAGGLVLVGGNGQAAIAGTSVATAPSVKVVDLNGNAVAGAAVTFTVLSGGGSITGANAVANALGVATVGSWTLGNVAGPNTLSAFSGSLAPVTFIATGTAGSAALITINAGNNQTATIGTAVAIVPSVKITDAVGNAINGASVTFAVASGGGSVTGAAASTNESGIATPGSWTLGGVAGANTLTASLNGVAGATVTFTATGQAAPALVIDVAGTLERGEKVTVTVTQNGSPLAVGSYTLAVVPSDAATINGDGTLLLTKAGVVTLNASASGGASGTKNINVATPPSVVFDLLNDGNRDIWRVALDGQELQRLTTDPADDQHPSAAAGKLMFASAREGNLHVYVVPLTGGTPVKITPNTSADTEPRISRNGQRFVYINNESGLGRATYANIDGSNPLPVASNGGNGGAIEFSPDWSPASDKVVFGSTAAGAADIYFANTLGSTAAFFAGNSSSNADLQPVYSPDGQKIAFISNRAGSSTDLYVANVDGSNVQKVVSNASGPAWARSDRLVYETVVFVPGQPLRGTLHWIDPANPGLVHDIDVGAGDARNASPIF